MLVPVSVLVPVPWAEILCIPALPAEHPQPGVPCPMLVPPEVVREDCRAPSAFGNPDAVTFFFFFPDRGKNEEGVRVLTGAISLRVRYGYKGALFFCPARLSAGVLAHLPWTMQYCVAGRSWAALQSFLFSCTADVFRA